MACYRGEYLVRDQARYFLEGSLEGWREWGGAPPSPLQEELWWAGRRGKNLLRPISSGPGRS